MQTLGEIKAMLAARGLAPRKALGQNFLIDKNLIAKLAAAADVGAGDRVLEVGPGTGALTEALLERRAHVVAVELDRGLAAMLRDRMRELQDRYSGSRLTVIEGDCLSGPGGRSVNAQAISALGPGEFKLVANLPYNAATPLLLALLIHHPACRVMGVTVQREVAERLGAGPRSKGYGTLGIVAQAMAEVETLATLPPECFWPRPEVISTMVLLRRRERPLTPDPEGLAGLAKRLFSKRRKQIGAILGRGHPLPVGVESSARPETLTVEQLVELRVLEAGNEPPAPG